MKKISIAFAFFIFAGLVLTTPAQTTKTEKIKDVDFSNFSYRAAFGDPANQKTIKLSGGKFEDGGSYENGGSLYELFDKPAYGDLNGDQNEDAVVEIKLSGAPTYRAFEVYAYTVQNGAAKMLARIDSDGVLKDYRRYYPKTDLHYAGNNPPKIQNGHIIVEALTEGNFACPKYTAVFDYKLNGGKFVFKRQADQKSICLQLDKSSADPDGSDTKKHRSSPVFFFEMNRENYLI